MPRDALTEDFTGIVHRSPTRDDPGHGIHDPVLGDAVAEIQFALGLVVVQWIGRRLDLDREDEVREGIGIRRTAAFHEAYCEDIGLHTVAATILLSHICGRNHGAPDGRGPQVPTDAIEEDTSNELMNV